MRVGDIETFDKSYLPGRARAGQEVNLSFRVAGPLITRPVNVSDKVKEGDVVARIDPRDFQVEVRNAEGQLDEAKATLERAQRDYDRLQRIFKQDPGATSQRAIDEAREERDRARASIKSLEARLTAAKDQLEYTYLKAPFDGTIVATYVENFQDVRANQPIVRLLDTQRIKFDVDVPENFISYVPSTTNIRVTFDVFPDKEVPAALFEIGSEASRTTRTYRVTLIMDQPKDFKILAGMAGKVRGDAQVHEENESGDIVIPVTAVFSPDRGETSYVWVIDETTKTVNRRQIQARRLIDAGIFVEDGLNPGELIVTAGVHFLEEGQEVRVLEEQGG
jgi:RND family efflux transporter MFP subunit